MKLLKDVLKESDLIVQIAEEFGLENVRIYPAIDPYEQNALNLAVDLKPGIPYSNVHPFQLELENKLVCLVNVTTTELVSPYKFNRLTQNMTSITNEQQVNELFKNDMDQLLNPPKSYDPVTERSELYNDVSFIRDAYLQRSETIPAISQITESLAVRQIKDQANSISSLEEINDIINFLINRKDELEKRTLAIKHNKS